MKKLILIAVLAFTLAACNDDNKRAQAFLTRAEQLMTEGDYSFAKLQIDSVRLLYPKAFEARREGIKLMQQIELKEQARTLAYLDSAYQYYQARFDSIKGNYVLEKDTAYQEIGNYFSPTQTVEKNLNRTFLRVQVSEKGVMTLTSIYCGQYNIHHTAVKVSSGELFAQTPVSGDVYETTDLGWHIEKADYPLGQDGDVIAFVASHTDKPIRATFLGDRSYTISLTAADKKAIADVYALAQVLGSMEQIRQQQKEANLKVEFIHRKMEEAKAETGD